MCPSYYIPALGCPFLGFPRWSAATLNLGRNDLVLMRFDRLILNYPLFFENLNVVKIATL